MKKNGWLIALVCLLSLSCSNNKAVDEKEIILKEKAAFVASGKAYKLEKVLEVKGRQGVASDGDYYYISNSNALYKYDKDGKLIVSNEKPFEDLELEANHFGDIDVHDGKIYTGIETFVDGVGENIQVAVYDANSLEYMYSIPWNKKSGQVEVCGLAIDRDHDRVWMADWVQGTHLYCYDLNTKAYIGKVELKPAPKLQQGIFIYKGQVIISCDNGDAEKDEADNLYYADIYPDNGSVNIPKSVEVKPWRKMTDFKRTGEIEGLTIDPISEQLIVLANRGARIILGMPKGFYSGYNREIHEIYIYNK